MFLWILPDLKIQILDFIDEIPNLMEKLNTITLMWYIEKYQSLYSIPADDEEPVSGLVLTLSNMYAVKLGRTQT